MKLYAYPETKRTPVKKSRVIAWLDSKTRGTLYGVQVKTATQQTRAYAHVINPSGLPVLFPTESEAEAYRARFVAERNPGREVAA